MPEIYDACLARAGAPCPRRREENSRELSTPTRRSLFFFYVARRISSPRDSRAPVPSHQVSSPRHCKWRKTALSNESGRIPVSAGGQSFSVPEPRGNLRNSCERPNPRGSAREFRGLRKLLRAIDASRNQCVTICTNGRVSKERVRVLLRDLYTLRGTTKKKKTPSASSTCLQFSR